MNKEDKQHKFVQLVVKAIVEQMGKQGMKTISRYQLTTIFGRDKFD